MKKLLSFILTLSMLLALIPAAFAAGDEELYAADQLHELGLFSGVGRDENGNPIYDLDRAPTRQEAITMLVGLLGKSEEAKAGTWETPFTDVDDWARPFVGYAYTHKLTSGTDKTLFGGRELVSASQYLTFVLKALGFEVGPDFQWDRAWELTDELNITQGQFDENTDEFLRGDVTLVSMRALGAKNKAGDATLLEQIETERAKNPAQPEEKPEPQPEPKPEPEPELVTPQIDDQGLLIEIVGEGVHNASWNFIGPKGTYTVRVLQNGQPVDDCSLTSTNRKHLAVKSNGDGSFQVTFSGKSTEDLEASVEEDIVLEDGKHWKSVSKVNMIWSPVRNIPGISLIWDNGYLERNQTFGVCGELPEYLLLYICEDGRQISDYTVIPSKNSKYTPQIQADGSLLLWLHGRENSRLTIQHGSHRGTFNLSVG